MSTLQILEPAAPLTLTAPGGGLTVDTPAFVGDLFVIPLATAAAGAEVACGYMGVWTLPKSAPLAITQGDNLYWSGTAVTKTSTDRYIGKSHADAGSAATTVEVVLCPGPQDSSNLADHLADTTDAHDASAISVLDSGSLYTATDVEAALAEIAGTGRTSETVKSVDAKATRALAPYQITFSGNNGTGDIAPTCRTDGATPAVGDKIVMITGYTTATGAALAMPTIGATDFSAALVSATGVKVHQINAGNLSANTYEALVIPAT